MSAESVNTRPDRDILADIQAIFTEYPPLAHDRSHIDVAVERGVVAVRGYVKTPPTYNYLRLALESVSGIQHIVADHLFIDEGIRRDVGQVVPIGTQVRVEYGAVILTGQLPEGIDVETLVKQVALVPGVHRVLTSFH